MQKGQERIRGLRSRRSLSIERRSLRSSGTSGVEPGNSSGIWSWGSGGRQQPSFGLEEVRVLAPKFDTRVDGPWREDDRRAFGNEGPRDGSVARCHTHRERDGRVKAQDLGAEGLQVGAAVDVGGLEVFTMLAR